jgi:membrane protein EpsK
VKKTKSLNISNNSNVVKNNINFNIGEAKKYFKLNIYTNVTSLALISIIELWMTRFLIDRLGVAMYGVIPTTASIISYAGLLSLTLTSSVGRFIAINLGKGQVEKSNIYFSSAFFGLILLGGIVFAAVSLLAPFINNIFIIPNEKREEFLFLLVMVAISSILGALCSPFMVSSFVTHRFYLQNLLNFTSKIIRAGIIIIGFIIFKPSLKIVGIAYCAMAVAMIALSVILTKKITPQLKIKKSYFQWNALREMGKMGGWVALDQIGTLLYLGTDLIVINLLLGPEKAGFYAPILQIVILMRLLTPTMSNLFSPIAIEYIAKEDFVTLSFQIQRAIKFLGLVLALPVGLVCGFSATILEKWLGSNFSDFSPLVWLLLAPQVLFLAIDPLYNVNRGMNKVKVPALATFFGGIINVLLSIVMVKFFNMGLYGVATAYIISFGIRTVIFTPIYSCLYLNINRFKFIKSLVPGLVVFVFVAFSALAANYVIRISSIFLMLTISFLIVASVISFLYLNFFEKEEKIFFSSFFKKNQQNFT